MKLNEISAYIIMALTLFLLVSLPALFSVKPDLSEPIPLPKIEDNTLTTPKRDTNFDPPNTNFITIIQVIAVLVLILILIKIIPNMMRLVGSDNKSRNKRELKEKEKIAKLLDARTQAYAILRAGLENENYTEAYIKAYQKLDEDLHNFREGLSRPIHWTPKEYSFTVRKPIFKPAVYKFVIIFYDIRYGSINATKENILLFIDMLDILFIDDVSSDVKHNMEMALKEMTGESIKQYQVPRRGDPSKPKGRQY